jgi:osomolarity two-component system phosphorelay intermediate protein YPD1
LSSQEKDYDQLGQLGHFLKGSSAQLGLRKVQEACRCLQELGGLDQQNEEQMMNALTEAMAAFEQTEIFLKRFLNMK